MDTLTEDLIKLGIAILVGGIIGAEREFRDKAAGFRTLILITVGSTLFTIFSLRMDPGFTQTRIAANIVTGIGFLGAGAIIREHGRIGGLTTAATIWLSAALGMGIGAGQVNFVMISTFAILVILLVFPRLEIWIDHMRESRTYRITVSTGHGAAIDKIHETLQAADLHVYEHHQSKIGPTIIGTWHTIGSPQNHNKFIDAMLKDSHIEEFVY
jgi:putative Mg2+ transporter-C (MgtC) family protein